MNVLRHIPLRLRSSYLSAVKCQRITMSSLSQLHEDAVEIFKAAVASVLPGRLVNDSCRRTPGGVMVADRLFPLKQNVHVVGFGKAVLGMAGAIEKILGEHIVSGVISVPKGIQHQMRSKPEMLLNPDSKIKVFEGAAGNLPDEDSLKAARSIAQLVSSLKDSDLLFVLISGGGSALLPSPIPPVTLAEKQAVVKMMADSGATIQEMNVVRKCLSLLKGGGLARLARPAQVVSLILSDIIDDPMDLIASGPTAENRDDPGLALQVIDKLGLIDKVPRAVLRILQESPKDSSDDCTEGVFNAIVGNNAKAADAASTAAAQFGYIPVVATLSIRGLANFVGVHMARLAICMYRGDLIEVEKECEKLELSGEAMAEIKKAYERSTSENKGLCVISAGETVVTVKGKGIGGRNQELALAASLEMQSAQETSVVLLSGGTDGIDGPTDSAGAIAAPTLVKTAEENGLNALGFLENNDSYTFFSQLEEGKWHLITGHTGTNVMDLVIILMDRKH